MAVRFVDPGPGADENPLSLGGMWATASGQSPWQRAGGLLTPTDLAGTDDRSYVAGITWPNNQYCEGDLTNNGTTGGGSGVGLMLRQAAAADTAYGLIVDHGAASNINIIKRVATVGTVLATVTQAWTDGARWRFEVKSVTATSHQLRGYRDGVLIISVTDTSIASGSPGLWFSTPETGASVANFVAGDFNDPLIRSRVSPALPGAQGFVSWMQRALPYAYSAPSSGAFTLPAVSGSYIFTGIASGLERGLVLGATRGQYTYTGVAANLVKGSLVGATRGIYTFTGMAAAFALTRNLVATRGIYSLTGNAAGLNKGQSLIAASGAYTLTGNAVGFARAYNLVAAKGTYTYTGIAAVLERGYVLTAIRGQYLFTGQDATLTKASASNPVMAAAPGSYAFTGNAAVLTYTPVAQVSPVDGSGLRFVRKYAKHHDNQTKLQNDYLDRLERARRGRDRPAPKPPAQPVPKKAATPLPGATPAQLDAALEEGLRAAAAAQLAALVEDDDELLMMLD